MSAAKPAKLPFVPALGSDWLTPFYDAVAWLLGDRTMKRRLITQARIAPGHDVLDLGCGTGTLALLIKEMHPEANVSGVDIDPRILTIARRKIAAVGVDIRIVQGSATVPPLPPASFDRVLSTLVLHHLTTSQKRAALAAVCRLLRPGGELHVADWGKPQNALMRLAALSFRISDSADTTGANLRGELPGLIAGVGFSDVSEIEHRMTPFGTLTYLRARAS
jgi:ubiquinone/menaquinone biosynthesis C-methylase UbiE